MKKGDNLISIIVPVYMVEQYLEKCIASIVAQSYKNLEIILVDDGSKDSCGDICDQWSRMDPRIKVIHKKNGGLSDARNVGLELAAGDYIGFVDSDDWIDPNMYRVLYDKMREEDADIVICGIKKMWDEGTSEIITKPGNALLDNREAMEALIKESWIKQPVWNRLYKREVVENIHFERGKTHEDVFWSYQPIARAGQVFVTDAVMYYYRQRETSIMGTEFSHRRIDAMEGYQRRLEFLKEKYPELYEDAKRRGYYFSMYLLQLALKAEKKDMVEEIIEKSKKFKPERGGGFWIKCAKVNMKLTCKLRNRLGIGL